MVHVTGLKVSVMGAGVGTTCCATVTPGGSLLALLLVTALVAHFTCNMQEGHCTVNPWSVVCLDDHSH